MRNLITLLCIAIGGTAGGALGAKVGPMTAYLLGVAGASVGLYFGRSLVRNHLE